MIFFFFAQKSIFCRADVFWKAKNNRPFAQLLVWVRDGASGDGRSITCTWIAPRTARNGDKKSTSRPSETLKLHVGDWPTVTGCPVSNPGNNCANGLFPVTLRSAQQRKKESKWPETAGLRVVNCGYHGNSYSFQHSVKSALFDRLCTPVRCPTTEFFLCGRSSKTFLLASLSGERCSGGQLLSTFSDLEGGLLVRKSWSTVSNSPGALCRISSSVAGLIPGERIPDRGYASVRSPDIRPPPQTISYT